MIPGQRQAIILELLRQRGVLAVGDVTAQCNCSATSVRRDLHSLEERGLVTRTHGGAVANVHANRPEITAGGSGILEARSALVDRSDALVATPTDTSPIRLLIERARRAGVPLISESVNHPGATSLVAVDDYQAGVELGRWVGLHAHRSIRGPIDVLDVSQEQANCRARSRGFAEGLHEAQPEGRIVARVYTSGVRDSARRVAADALALHPDINVIFGINDDSALGGLDAFYALGLDDRNLLVCSFGLEGNTSKDMLMAGGPFKASVAMFPELVGRTCVEAANCAYHGCHLPERIITPFVIATAGNLEDYYERDDQAGAWNIKWAAVQRLPTAGTTLAMLSRCAQGPRPVRIGYVLACSTHHWYRNLRRAMEERALELGIQLEVIDASNDVEQEIDRLKRLIGQTAACYIAEGDTVVLDSGLTCAHLAGALHGRRGITILTNSLRVLNELAQEPGIRLISTGGELRTGRLSLTGAEAESTFQGMRAEKVFISGAGLSIDFGLSGTNPASARVRQAMLAATRDAIVLADHTKIGVESLVRIAPIERFGRLITDAGISPHDRLSFTKRGIEVSIAEVGNLP